MLATSLLHFESFRGGYWNLKKKNFRKITTLVLSPTRKEYWYSEFHVSGHVRACYSLFGKARVARGGKLKH